MTMLLEADIQKHCEKIDEINQNCFTIPTDKVLSKIDTFDQIFSDIHEGNIRKATVQRPLKDKKATFIGELSIASPYGTSKIVGLEIMPDGKLLVCDQTQQSIALLDIDYNNLQVQALSSVTLSSVPYSMVLMNDTSAFVSLPNEKTIQKAEITHNNLVLTSTVPDDTESNHEYIRLVKYKQNLLAHERLDDGSIITEIDQDGKEIQLIHVTNDSGHLIQSIGFISVSPNLDTIYITEKKHGCIGISMNGDLVFQYKANDVQTYQGVYVDTDGYIYLAELDKDNIVVVNDKGEKIKDLVTMKGMQPNCLTFDSNGDRLLVVKGKLGKILAFELD